MNHNYVFRVEIYNYKTKHQSFEAFFSTKEKADNFAKLKAEEMVGGEIEPQTKEPSKTLYGIENSKGELMAVAVSRLTVF